MRSQMDIPKAIQNAPQLQVGLGLYLSAWLDLNSCRSSGMSQGPIPWLAVRQYAADNDFSNEQREDLHHHIAAMDATYFQYRENKVETGG